MALRSFKNLLVTFLTSILLIILGLIYFMVNLWIITFGSRLLGYTLSGDWAVLSAVLLTLAGIIGSSLERK